jgi:hypothetical protein
VEIVNDEILLLTPAISFNREPFTQTFTETRALDEITLEPLHVCLNEEPEFEFYDDDRRGYDVTGGHDVMKDHDITSYDVTCGYDVTKSNDVTRGYDVGKNASACSSSSDLPPEPPLRDYSKHDLESQEIFEEPIIPYNSPVYELHPSLMRTQLKGSSHEVPNAGENDSTNS